MDKLVVLLLCFYFVSAKIKINDLRVPESIESGTAEDVILDCDFDTGGESGIEVKWFVNGLVEQIYQWIPETNKSGQAIGKWKDNIDVHYKISNDRNSMYRALHMVNIRPELSGNYSCKVSGDTTEDVVMKSMIIYEPADAGLELAIAEEESVILCTSDGIFPEPNMKVYITNENGSEILFQEEDETVELDENGLYNISSTLYFTPENITSPFYFHCELNIPGTTYFLKESRLHYLENDQNESSTELLQIEEDYLNSFNTTESSFNVTQDIENEEEVVETQLESELVIERNCTSVEEESEENKSEESKENEENDEIRENGCLRKLPSFHLISLAMVFFGISFHQSFQYL